jgi:hypothetical protein
LIAVPAALQLAGRLRGVARQFWGYYASPPGAFAFILLWIGVTALASEVYMRRRSYLA